MASSSDVRLLGPLKLEGPAVEREKRILEESYVGPELDEKTWLQRARDQSKAIEKAEVAFFEELRRRTA